MLFDQITLIDSCRLTEEGIQEIATFSRQPLLRYYDVPTSFGIFDSDGIGTHYQPFSELNNVLLYPRSAGFTKESKVRLTQKVIANLTSFLE